MSATIKLSSPATKEFWEIPVLFEDGDLLALDKPAGLLTAPDPDNLARPSLTQLLHDGIADGKPWAVERSLAYLNPAPRPDAEATGVVLLAKNKPAYVALANLFGAERPLRHHVALAWGNRGGDPVYQPVSINGITLDVPEPASLALVGLALLGLTALRRRA